MNRIGTDCLHSSACMQMYQCCDQYLLCCWSTLKWALGSVAGPGAYTPQQPQAPHKKHRVPEIVNPTAATAIAALQAKLRSSRHAAYLEASAVEEVVKATLKHGTVEVSETCWLCCAVPCRALQCCAVLCRAVPCCAVLCRAVPCCAVLCRAVPCCAATCYAQHGTAACI